MKFFAKTSFGKIRQINQDYYIAENRKVGIFPNLFIVADGVGSNRESEFASKHCSNFVLDQLQLCTSGSDYKEEFLKAYRLANKDLVYRIMANRDYNGMGTTMVATSIINNKAIVVNVGDSRLYLLRNNIKQITNDHSLAEELVQENEIEKYSEKYYELKSQLSRAFGQSKNIEPDFFEVELFAGDYILLCTDGLTNMVDDAKIYEIVNKNTNIETKVDDLIDEANNNGGRDNIAIILIYIDEINKENLVFEKEKQEFNEEIAKALIDDSDEKEKNIKKILDKRLEILNKDFKSRSRKRKEVEDNEKN